MVFLVAALLLLGLLSGTVAHIPPAVSLLAAAVVAAWLLVFAERERERRTRRRDH
ncbi:hypothetical protein AB0F13_21220 [Streptomyces sp. NPDC026206]|uniref:hypothetical protein n=1 Tax=Streptomyces sp. NPDC026206 TaxID=3157089 RepID=UPI0033D6B422